ncbi:hypothetical protein AAG570_006053 [Ranatra chinensis]|uniref:Uncharacterized protein n=1 Tax=Ranatra chinensis TaxID=642074 RepID=A0ABD0XX81_9HEMI
MACAVERVSLYCGGEGAGPRPELRSDVSCQEESSRSSCSSSAGGGCGGTTTSSAITTTSTGTRNKRKAASPRRRQLAKRPRPEESPFRPWGGHQETDDHEETGRSPSGEERIPEVIQSPQPAGRPEDMASSSSQDSPPSTQPRPMDFPPPPPPPTSRLLLLVAPDK